MQELLLLVNFCIYAKVTLQYLYGVVQFKVKKKGAYREYEYLLLIQIYIDQVLKIIFMRAILK